MYKSVARYVYHYGLVALVRRCLNRNAKPRGMGYAYLFCCGVCRVGSLWAIPTLKSVRTWLLLRGAKHIDVVLTLMWGGGSAAYVDEMIRRKAVGEWTIVVKPTGAVGCLSVLMWNGSERVIAFEMRSLNALLGLKGRRVNLVINHLIQWHYFVTHDEFSVEDYEKVIDSVLALRRKLQAQSVFMVHDYFSVCPRCTLTTAGAVYCASEYSFEKCAGCLNDNMNAYLAFKEGFDIHGWRSIWQRLFDGCDEIRTFSEDSKGRMRQIFPAARLTLVPHCPVAFFKRKPQLQKKRLVVGVFGNILDIKGSGIVIDLVKLIRKKGLQGEVVVVGDLTPPEGVDIPVGMVVRGKYQREQLIELIEIHGINISLFPSVCPETFSYVTQELMLLDLPIVCFDIGAPKDRVRTYDKGFVCKKMNACAALEAIHALAMKQGVKLDE